MIIYQIIQVSAPFPVNKFQCRWGRNISLLPSALLELTHVQAQDEKGHRANHLVNLLPSVKHQLMLTKPSNI